MNQRTSHPMVESRWAWLYQAGAVAALLSALFIPIQILVFIVWPPPLQGSVNEWFALFQENRLVGLVDLDLLLVADNVLLIPLFLALYILLRRANESLMLMATALGFLGIIMYIASNPAIEMLSLSNQYAAATSDAQRIVFLAAGQAMLATWQGTAFQVAYLAGSVAGIAMGVAMLRSGVFGSVTATLAILGNAIGLGLYIPIIGLYISVFSVLFLEIWYILLAWRLFQLGRGSLDSSGASELRWESAPSAR
jgi:hypothetical protein